MEALRAWMVLQRSQVPDGSATAKALEYSLRRWEALTRFVDDGNLPVGRVEMWRRYGRLGLICLPQLSRARCPNNSAVALFPHPSHQTGRADFPHPAFF